MLCAYQTRGEEFAILYGADGMFQYTGSTVVSYVNSLYHKHLLKRTPDLATFYLGLSKLILDNVFAFASMNELTCFFQNNKLHAYEQRFKFFILREVQKQKTRPTMVYLSLIESLDLSCSMTSVANK